MGAVIPLRRTRVEAEDFLAAARCYVSASESAFREAERLRGELATAQAQVDELRDFTREVAAHLGLVEAFGDEHQRRTAADLRARALRLVS